MHDADTRMTRRDPKRVVALGASTAVAALGLMAMSPVGGMLIRLATPERSGQPVAPSVMPMATQAAGWGRTFVAELPDEEPAGDRFVVTGLGDEEGARCVFIRTANFEAPEVETTVQSRRTTTIVENDGRRTIKLEINNGEVAASIDGKPVPSERVQRQGDAIIIKDESGNEIYRYEDAGGTRLGAGMLLPPGVQIAPVPPVPPVPPVAPDVRMWTFNRSGGDPTGPGAWQTRPAEPAAKSMIGVQLIEPDASLRGHFGLRRGEATLVAAVYDGLPAAAAGLEPYDLIVAVEGTPTAGVEDVRAALRQRDPGSAVQITVIKKGERKTLTLTPEAFDREKLNRAKVERMASADMNSPFGVFMGDRTRSIDPDALAAMSEQMSSAFADGFKDFGQQFAQAWSTPEAREKWMEEFREAWKNSGPQRWSAGGGDPVVAVIPEPDGGSRAEVFMRLRAEQQEFSDRLRKLADEVRSAARARGNVAPPSGQAQGLGADAARELEQHVERLQEMIKQMREHTPPVAPPAEKPAPEPKERSSTSSSSNRRVSGANMS